MNELFAGRFRVLRELGRGGFGVVYEAEDLTHNHLVALKVLLPTAAAGPNLPQRLVREAKALSRVRSTYVANVLDAGQDDEGTPYIAMELVDGQPLQAELASRTVSRGEGIRWLAQVADGLSAAHDAGIVHRDVKPSNILVDRDGTAKLLDFGVCRLFGEETLTKTGTTLGTVHYMSPEQLTSAAKVTSKSDVWSLGVVMYAMFSGTFPYDGSTPLDVARNILSGPPKPLGQKAPGLPRELSDVCESCMRISPDDRPDAAHLAAQLRSFLGSEPAEQTAEATLVDSALHIAPIPVTRGTETATLVRLDLRGAPGLEGTERMPDAPTIPALPPIPAAAVTPPTPPPAVSAKPASKGRNAIIAGLSSVGVLLLALSVLQLQQSEPGGPSSARAPLPASNSAPRAALPPEASSARTEDAAPPSLVPDSGTIPRKVRRPTRPRPTLPPEDLPPHL